VPAALRGEEEEVRWMMDDGWWLMYFGRFAKLIFRSLRLKWYLELVFKI
jgi:hypothetical protein